MKTANPNNYEKLAGRKDILENNIQIHNLAVSDQTRIIEFYLYNLPDIERDWIVSMKKHYSLIPFDKVEVKSTKLDHYLSEFDSISENMSIWIDVEGAAYEVLIGLGSYINQVGTIHVELEIRAMYYTQTVFSEVNNLLMDN